MPFSCSNTLSSPASSADAGALLAQISVKPEAVDISPMVDAFIARDPGMDRLRRGNLMARARMITLYDISARDRAIVVGTSNKTEILLGYSTIYGDSASAMNPIGDLYKTQVRQLSRAMNIPAPIIDKAPSADLWDGQTDEGELGYTYNEMQESILRIMQDQWSWDSKIDVFVLNRHNANKHKHEAPPVSELRGFCK